MLLKIDDIASELGVCRKTVYKYLHDEGLDRYVSRIGGRYFTTSERLQQFVEDMIITK